jgi:hypothetical protein
MFDVLRVKKQGHGLTNHTARSAPGVASWWILANGSAKNIAFPIRFGPSIFGVTKNFRPAITSTNPSPKIRSSSTRGSAKAQLSALHDQPLPA